MLTLLLLAISLAAPAAPPAVSPAIEVTIDIHPSSADHYQLLKRRPTPDTFTCQANVMEAESHRLYGDLNLVVGPGESDHTTKTFGDYTMTFGVSLKNNRADAVVEVKRGEQLITRQRSIVHLQQPVGNVPLN